MPAIPTADAPSANAHARPWILCAFVAALATRLYGWFALKGALFAGLPAFEDAVHFSRIRLLLAQFPETALPAGSPGYPYPAALTVQLGGGTAAGAFAVQALLAVAGVWLVAWSLAPLLAPRARWIAALIYALHPVGLVLGLRFQPMIYALWLLLPAVRLLFLQRELRLGDATLGGLLLGIGFLFEPLLFAALAIAAIWSRFRAPRTAVPARRPLGAGLVLIGFLLVPALLAGYHASLPGGAPVWNWSGAHAFHRSLSPDTWGTARALTPPVWESPQEAATFANEQTGRDLTPGELFHFYAARGLQRLVEHPVAFVGQTLRRLALLFSAPEIPDPVSLRHLLRAELPALQWGLYLYPLLLALAMVGLAVWRGDERAARGTGDPPRDGRCARLLAPLIAVVAVNVIGTYSAASRWYLVLLLLAPAAAVLARPRAVIARIRQQAPLRRVVLAALALLLLSALDPLRAKRFENRSEDLRVGAQVVLSATGSHQEATRLVRQAVRADDGNPVAHKDHGDLLLAEELTDAARQAYERALELDPGYAAARYGLAEVHRKLGDYPRADSLLTALVNEHPQHPLYLNQLAAVKMLAGDPEVARVLLRRALEIKPDYETAQINLQALEETERRVRSLTLPDELAGSDADVMLAVNRAAGALRSGRLELADSLSREALARYPDAPIAQLMRGMILLRSDRSAEATDLLTHVVRQAPGRAMSTGLAVEALMRDGRAQEAHALARESLAAAQDERNRGALENLVERLERSP